MIVAWQFIARDPVPNGSVPLGYGVMLQRELTTASKNGVDRSNHTVPNGTEPFLAPFLAINCQAAIIQFLRGNQSRQALTNASNLSANFPVSCNIRAAKPTAPWTSLNREIFF